MTSPHAERRPSPPHAVTFRNIRPFGGPPVDLTVIDGVIDRIDDGIDDGIAGARRCAHPPRQDLLGRALVHPPSPGTQHRRPRTAGRRAPPVPAHPRRCAGAPPHGARRGVRHPGHAGPGRCGPRLRAGRPRRRQRGANRTRRRPRRPDRRLPSARAAPGTRDRRAPGASGPRGPDRLVGGIDPAGFDANPDQLDTVFGLAERHRLGVDIHLHDRGDRGLAPLREIIARTRALDVGGHVTVSHVFCVPELAPRELDALAGELAAAGVSLTTVALDSTSVLPHRRLRAHGVRVGIGSDGVRDAWSPFGTADMLHRAHLLGYCTGARLDEELDACYLAAAHDGAALLGLSRADFVPGAPADFLLVDGECLAQAVVDVPRRRMVVRAGRVVARDGALC